MKIHAIQMREWTFILTLDGMNHSVWIQEKNIVEKSLISLNEFGRRTSKNNENLWIKCQQIEIWTWFHTFSKRKEHWNSSGLSLEGWIDIISFQIIDYLIIIFSTEDIRYCRVRFQSQIAFYILLNHTLKNNPIKIQRKNDSFQQTLPCEANRTFNL